MRRIALASLCAVLLAACSRERPGDIEAIAFPQTETVIDYEPRIVGAPSDEMEALLIDSLDLFRRQDDGAQSVALLRRRARDDIAVAIRVLRSFGHYGASAEVEVIEGPALPSPGEDVGPEGEGAVRTATAVITLQPGPAYMLARHDFALVGAIPPPEIDLPSAAELGSPVGEPALAAPILAAERAALSHLRDSGRPWARAEGRRAVADPAEATLEIDSALVPGAYAEFGPIRFVGLERVNPDHLLTYVPWREGGPVVSSALVDYQRSLMETELFAGASVTVPETPPEDGEVVAPITVRLEEGPRRSVTAGLRFNSDTGPLARGGFRHRNLFGSGERIDLAVEAGLERQAALLTGRVPQVGRPGQDLLGSLELRNQETDAFDELAATLALGVERRLSRSWSIGAGGLAEIAEVRDDTGTETVLLFGIPAFATYDNAGNPLDRTDGERANFLVTPFRSVTGSNEAPFLLLEVNGAIYRPLDAAATYVVAARGRLGSLVSSDFDDIPAPRRLFSGGGGSVRGYQERFIGPIDADDNPVGGRSVAEVGLELRGRIRGDLGGVLFAEAGTVSREMFPDFAEDVQYAAGAGIRYYTPVGPIRLDVAVPLNPRDVDDAFAFYFSIGQAF